MPKPESGGDALEVYLLDMGKEQYGDCILCRTGGRSILIDGGHPGDWTGRNGYPSIPEQLGEVMRREPPFEVDLLVVTHCHSDHIGCLPALVLNGVLKAKRALVASERLGFGALAAPGMDAIASPRERLFALMREEDHAGMDDLELSHFMEDAATLRSRYRDMLARLEKDGTEVCRYEGPAAEVAALESEFADFGLEVLGPSGRQLELCAKAISSFSAAADAALEGALAAADAKGVMDLYRALARGSDEGGAEDRPGKGAAINDQSIVLKLEAGGARLLFAGDMQFAAPEVRGVEAQMAELNAAVSAAGPYGLVKLSHHTSYNGVSEGMLDGWLSRTKKFAHSGGIDDATHPDPKTLGFLKARSEGMTWARTDRNGRISIACRGGKIDFGISRGSVNDFTANGDEGAEGKGFSPAEGREAREPVLGPGGESPKLAGGRALPKLLFVTSIPELANNLGKVEAEAACRMVAAAGQSLLDVKNAADPYGEVRKAFTRDMAGIVILGGYDVLPSKQVDALPPKLRRRLGNDTADADNFIVWNDEAYGDLDGDGFPEAPVSRIPDAKSPRLVMAALSAADPAAGPRRFGLRNSARPFADMPFTILRGSEALLVSAPATPESIGEGKADAPEEYLMLHGSDADATRFWGELDGSMIEALSISNIPRSYRGVVFTGCCWGALTVQATARQYLRGGPLGVRTPGTSIALSFLHAGAKAFVGCTGTHYSPVVPPYGYFGGPMHEAFWKCYIKGMAPAEALFRAKIEYARAMPHGQGSPEGQGIEYKIWKEYTCLGLGW